MHSSCEPEAAWNNRIMWWEMNVAEENIAQLPGIGDDELNAPPAALQVAPAHQRNKRVSLLAPTAEAQLQAAGVQRSRPSGRHTRPRTARASRGAPPRGRRGACDGHRVIRHAEELAPVRVF